MKEKLTLVSLNIEGDKHNDTVLPFLESQKADVVCLQEIFKEDARAFSETLGYRYHFLPMLRTKRFNKDDIDEKGIAVFAKGNDVSFVGEYYYRPHPTNILDFNGGDEKEHRASIAHGVVVAKIPFGDKVYTIATTHFPVTPHGKSNAYQHEDIISLMALLSKYPELVICGDFNVPRGYNDIYPILTSRFKDNIPVHFPTTLDMLNHRPPSRKEDAEEMSHYVVDYIFTTPLYVVENVALTFGVSDHAGVSGEVVMLNN